MASDEGRNSPWFLMRAVQQCSKGFSAPGVFQSPALKDFLKERNIQRETNSSFAKEFIDEIRTENLLPSRTLLNRRLIEQSDQVGAKFALEFGIMCGVIIALCIGGSVAFLYDCYRMISGMRRKGSRKGIGKGSRKGTGKGTGKGSNCNCNCHEGSNRGSSGYKDDP